MFNKIILCIAAGILVLSVILSLTELMFRRNSAAGRFTRFFLIRLREFSMTKFFVSSILLLLWGLVIGDDSFEYLWIFILVLALLLVVLHPIDFFCFKKKRRKAKQKKEAPRLVRTLAEAALTKELPPLTEILPASEEEAQ